MNKEAEKPTEKLTGGQIKYKNLVKDFGKGSDGSFLHFTAHVELKDVLQ